MKHNIARQCGLNSAFLKRMCQEFCIDIDIELVAGFVLCKSDPISITVHIWCIVDGKIVEPSYEFANIPNSNKIYSHSTKEKVSEPHQEIYEHFKESCDKYNKKACRSSDDYYLKLEKYVLDNIPHKKI